MSDVRAFAALLHGLEDGQLLADLNAKLHGLNVGLAREADNAGKAKGALTLRLNFSAERGGTISIDSEVIVKEPKPARARTVLWLTKDQHLSQQNPRQTLLGFPQEVPRADDPPREVPETKTEARSV